MSHPGHMLAKSNPGDDATTADELRGWYCFDWANSVYSTVAIGGFLPLLLKNLAQKDAGFPLDCPNVVSNITQIQSLFNDPSVEYMHAVANGGTVVNACTDAITCVGGYCRGLPTLASECLSSDGSKLVPLDVNFLGLMVDPTSFTTGIISVSTLFQLVAFLSTSALADYGNMRKKWLMFFTYLGSSFTILNFFMTPELYWLCGICVIVSNIGFGAGGVFYNSYLPLLAANCQEVLDAPEDHKLAVRAKKEDEISAKGFIAGYVSAVVLLMVCVPIAFVLEDFMLGYKINISLAGIWWVVFSFYTFSKLKERPGEPLPAGSSYLTQGWVNAWQTFTVTRHQLKTCYKFLICWFFFSDGVFLISSVGALFASEEVDWGCFSKSLGVSLMFLLVPLMAAFGGWFYENLCHQRWGYSNKKIIIVNLFVYVFMSIYGCLGFIFEDIGIKKGWEIVVFGAIYGFNLGSIQSYSRALFSSLIPRGMEAQMFGFFEVTDKGSSWIGPAVAAFIKQVTRELRYTFFYMIVVLLVSAYFLSILNVEQGMREAMEFSHIKGSSKEVDDATEMNKVANPVATTKGEDVAEAVQIEV